MGEEADYKKENDTETSVKLISQKHAMVRANKEKAVAELLKIKAIVITEEARTNEKAGELCIAEQNLRSLNEQYYYAKKGFDEKEEEKAEIIRELVKIELSLIAMKEKIKNIKNIRQNTLKVQQNHREKLKTDATGEYPEYEGLLQSVDKLQDLKLRLDCGESELQGVIDGTTLNETQSKISAVHDAMAQLEMNSNTLLVEIDEKRELIETIQVQMQMDENQHQARMRKLQKQLQDLESNENQMKIK